MAAPTVFLSHAWADKERFVMGFAEKLMAKGVDVWLDKWSMNPGDSLVDKIFEEGIANAKAFIVVISENSVDKKWVREELNTAVVRRIEGKTKLIPIIIDDCQIPESLQSTVWIRITDPSNYEIEFQRIINAIFDHYEKPVLGEPPSFTKQLTTSIPGLSSVESLVLKLSMGYAMTTRSSLINTRQFLKSIEGQDLVPDVVVEALEVLSFHAYIETNKSEGGGIMGFKITVPGFRAYASAFIEEYPSLLAQVASQIVNQSQRNSSQIAQRIDQSPVIVKFIMDSFEADGYFKVTSLENGVAVISTYSPALKQVLDGVPG